MHTINDKSITTYVAHADTDSLQRITVKDTKVNLIFRKFQLRRTGIGGYRRSKSHNHAQKLLHLTRNFRVAVFSASDASTKHMP